MGDPALASGGEIGGYYDHQYLVLDTPVIPISTGNCTLTFKMRHGLEDPGEDGTGYDGWDSFNLRISTNNGISYEVVPDTTAIISPVYDFNSSYAFGSEHGEGLGVPGWGGVREWVTVTVDLTAYLATPNVKIRFAFASDPAYSTADQPDLYGVMVDDILLASYSNNGVDDSQMSWSSLVPTAGDFWHVATDATAPSPTHIMSSLNTAGTYVPFMLNYLESPSIVLPTAATQIIADFKLKGTYFDAGVFPDVDYFGWEISPDNGVTWRYMSNVTADPDGDNYVYSSSPENWASMINSYTLDGDITLFAGNTVKFRWYFQSNGNTPIGTPLQIDDFQIFSVTAAPAAPDLTYPANNGDNIPLSGFVFDWTPSSLGALPEFYYLYMDQSLDAVEGFYAGYTSDELPLSYCYVDSIPGLTLGSNETWYWMVEAGIAGQPSAYSQIFRFTTLDTSEAVTTFPWVENFDAALALPADWTMVDVDAGGTAWEPTTTYANSAPNAFRHVYSTAVPDPGQNGWLITPPIQLPATGIYMLGWYNYNVYPTYMVYNGVKINLYSNSPADPNWIEIWSQDAASQAWTAEAVNLSAYGGQVVYVAFNYQGYDADNWYIDDVSVYELTADETPPTITHLPVLNTPRPDINYYVYADIVDDATWNNPITVANVYYSTDGGTTFNPPIAMTLDREGYYAYIPAQALGTDVTYYLEASDSENNYATTGNYSFGVADPTWIWYDTGGTSWTWFGAGQAFSPVVLFENPFYDLRAPVVLNAVDGLAYDVAAGTSVTATMHIYGWDGVGDETNFVDLITPTAVTFAHQAYEVFDLTSYNLQITTPYFLVSYDLPVSAAFLYDATYDYGTTYVMIDGGLFTLTNPGAWCIGANVQSLGMGAPEVTIALNGLGQPEVSWPAVDGAASYDVFGSADPYAADPWTQLADDQTGLFYTYTGADPMNFFKVTASSEAPSRTVSRSINATQLPVTNLPLKLKPASF